MTKREAAEPAPTDVFPIIPNVRVERRQIICMADLEGEPIPWSRAGQGKLGQRYTQRAYREHRDALAWALTNGRQHIRHPVSVDVGLFATFYRSTRRAADLDNLAKAVGDAGNDIVWGDDRQITLLIARLVIDRDNPRTELVVFRRELPVEDAAGVP